MKIFLENLKFFIFIFLESQQVILENAISCFLGSELDSESLSTLRKIIFKREASRVEGYVTPSCTRNETKCQKSEKSKKIWEVSKKIWEVSKKIWEVSKKIWEASQIF